MLPGSCTTQLKGELGMRCPICEGKGQYWSSEVIQNSRRALDPEYVDRLKTCGQCKGTGAVTKVGVIHHPKSFIACAQCHATGTVKKQVLKGTYASGRPMYEEQIVTCPQCKGSKGEWFQGYDETVYESDQTVYKGSSGCALLLLQFFAFCFTVYLINF